LTRARSWRKALPQGERRETRPSSSNAKKGEGGCLSAILHRVWKDSGVDGDGAFQRLDHCRQPPFTGPEWTAEIVIDVSSTGRFWHKLVAFLGPGYFVAVGYIEPGNWATSLAGGSKFGYALLSNVMAIILQALCAAASSPHSTCSSSRCSVAD
jgi:hypothetical protein